MYIVSCPALLPLSSAVPLFLCQIPLAYRPTPSAMLFLVFSSFVFVVHSITFETLFPFILCTCPYQTSCFLSMSSIIELSISIRCLISSFLIFSFCEILIDGQIAFISIASSMLSYFFRLVSVQPYRITLFTIVDAEFLLFRDALTSSYYSDMRLSFAFVILLLISWSSVPSRFDVIPRYLYPLRFLHYQIFCLRRYFVSFWVCLLSSPHLSYSSTGLRVMYFISSLSFAIIA